MALALNLSVISTGSAVAQTAGGPPIAYVKKSNTGDEIYLVNPENTGLLRLYKAPRKTSIGHIDLRPGGGEIAFTEDFRTLKILSFDSYGRPGVGEPRTVREMTIPCSLFGPDYHPTDGRLAYIEGCGAANFAVWTVQPGATEPNQQPMFGHYGMGRIRWSSSNHNLYYAAQRNDGTSNVYLYERESNNIVSNELGPIEGYATFGVVPEGNTGNKIFWSVGDGTFKLLDTWTQTPFTYAATTLCLRAQGLAFGPGGSAQVYVSPHLAKGDYVMVGASDCSGRPIALTGKGNWGSMVDWRE